MINIGTMAFGQNTGNTIMGHHSDAHGNQNSIVGYNSVIYGNTNTILGQYVKIKGNNNNVHGKNNNIKGDNNLIVATNLILVGNNYSICRQFPTKVYINDQFTYNILLFFYTNDLVDDVICYFLSLVQKITKGVYCYHYNDKFICIK